MLTTFSMFARNVWTKYAKNTAVNLYCVYMMDFACSNMVIYDTSKSVSFIKVSETYSSTKISEITGIIISQCTKQNHVVQQK